MSWDVFISHATEDKAEVASPLAEALQAKGFSVWYDEYTLVLGDNLRRSIEHGLAQSRMALLLDFIELMAMAAGRALAEAAQTLRPRSGTANCETVPRRSSPQVILVRILSRPTMQHE